MTATAVLLLAMTAVVAVLDWGAVAADRRAVEYVAKPLTTLGLLAVAVALDPTSDAVRAAVVVALVASLIGDVFLMLPGDRFVPGLVGFFVAHVAYVVAMVLVVAEVGAGVASTLAGLGVGLVVVLVGLGLVGRRIVVGARGAAPEFAAPVVAYMGVISAMVATAVATGSPVVVAGALSFYVSDALIGWTRFVHDLRHGRVGVMVTYHVGQALLLLGLVLAR